MEGQTTSNPVLLPYPNFTTPTRANSKSIAVKNAAGETVTLAGSTELAVPSAATQPQPFIVKFYDPTTAAKDSQGRSLSSMLQWDDDKLEFKHD